MVCAITVYIWLSFSLSLSLYVYIYIFIYLLNYVFFASAFSGIGTGRAT